MTGTRRFAVAAAVADAICLAVFVAAGRQSHDIGGGAGWFVAVLWPFLAGWFAAAMVTQLYTARSRWLARTAATVIAGVALALLLRATVTHRGTPVAFIVVAYAFVALLVVGWRLLLLGVRQVQRRRRSDTLSA